MMRCTVRARRCGSRSRISALASQFDAIHGFQLLTIFRALNPIHQKSSRSSAGVRMRRSTSTRMRSRSSGETLVEPLADQVVGPREQRGRLGREQLDDRLGDVGQTGAALLRAEVRRGAPERLLGDGPDAVGDLVDEAALVLEHLADDERGEPRAAARVHVVVLRAVAVAHVAQRHRGGDAPPLGAELALRGLHERLADGGGHGVPPLALVDRGIGMPALARHEHRRELRLAGVAGEQVARRLRAQRRRRATTPRRARRARANRARASAPHSASTSRHIASSTNTPSAHALRAHLERVLARIARLLAGARPRPRAAPRRCGRRSTGSRRRRRASRRRAR